MFYQEALPKFWLLSFADNLLAIGDRHWQKGAAMFEKPTQQIHFRIRNDSLVLRLFFSHTEGKFSLVNCPCILFTFYCSLKVGDTTSCTYYTMSYKAWKLRKSSAHCRDHTSQSFRTPKTKIHETWSLCQHHRDPITSLQHLSSGTSYCRLASSETHTASSRK